MSFAIWDKAERRRILTDTKNRSPDFIIGTAIFYCAPGMGNN